MKRRTAIIIVIIAVMMMVTSCGQAPAVPEQTPVPTPPATPPVTEAALTEPAVDKVITVMGYGSEVPDIAQSYADSHPDFGYTINGLSGYDDYEGYLKESLETGSEYEPDIYCTESISISRFTNGDLSVYAMPYEDLGLDVDAGIAAAKIAPYTVELGTRSSDGKIIGLSYQGAGGAFIYRRSIAKKVWGIDDPAAIADKIGPGWGKFFAAAKELKKKGYSIVSGIDDIWQPIAGSSDKGWIVEGKLYIDPRREEFFDYSKKLIDKGYSNDNMGWTEEWYNDMADKGPRPVFGFFGASWFIDYVIAGNSGARYEYGKLVRKGGTYGDWAVCRPTENFFWGGIWVFANKELENDPAKKAAVAELIEWMTLDCTKDGLQYLWANGNWGYSKGVKDAVTSETVMEMSDGTKDFLGGQDIFDVFLPAARNINSGNITDYDNIIYRLWRDQADKYAHGERTREEAIAAFKQAVKERLGADAL